MDKASVSPKVNLCFDTVTCVCLLAQTASTSRSVSKAAASQVVIQITVTAVAAALARSMSAAPGCHKITVSTFLKHPCCNNRFIRQQAARLASTQCGSPRLSSSKFASGTQMQNAPSNGHKCSAFFKFGKSKDSEYKGDSRHQLYLLISLTWHCTQVHKAHLRTILSHC